MILRVQYTEQKHCIIMRVQNKEQDLNPVREHCIIMSLIYSVGLEPSQGALYDIESSIYRAGPEPVREHCIIMRVQYTVEDLNPAKEHCVIMRVQYTE